MAKFAPVNTSSEDVPGLNRNFKVSGQHSTQGNSGVTARKAALEHLTSPSSPPAPAAFQKPLKPAFGVKSSPNEAPERYTKPNSTLNRYTGSIHASNKEPEVRVGFPKTNLKPTEPKKEEKTPFGQSPPHKTLNGSTNLPNDHKPVAPKPSFLVGQQAGETKPSFPKPSQARAAFSGAQEESAPKPLFPKKQDLGPKLSLTTNTSQNEDTTNTNTFLTKAPAGPKPGKPNFLRQSKEPAESTNGPEHSPAHFGGVVLKPTGTRAVQNSFLSPKTDDSNVEKKQGFPSSNLLKKVSNDSPNATSAPSPFRKPNSSTGDSQEEKGSNTPKRKALPSLFKLGPAPAKPNRPPHVDLEKFRNHGSGDNLSKGGFNKPSPSHSTANTAFSPPPPPTHPTTQAVPPPPPMHPTTIPAVPSLPPRNIPSALPGLDDSYDDVEIEASSFQSNTDGSGDKDDDIYDLIDENSNASTKEDEKKKEKDEKKRQEQKKKEQKEREKKEQEIRKRFKLVGPVEVLHQAKASIDCKGGKNDLSFKQGDVLDIIRLTDNPEGKWLARANGTYGYVKTTSVEVTLPKKPRPSVGGQSLPAELEQEVYDDVAEQDSMGRQLPGKSIASTFPPAPSEEDIYDEMNDDEPGKRCLPQEEEKSWTWTLLKKFSGKEDKVKSANDSGDNEGFVTLSPLHLKDSGDGEVYDDIETHDFPPPPKELSGGSYIKNLTLGKGDEKDAKRLKKMEKEEKEFRKKFKYEGEINVIQSAHVLTSMSTKKWGAKDLPVKPGESVEIIQNTDDSKVLCRNDEGKYGYVMRSNLDTGNAGEIYDDVGDSCIYDND